MQDVAKDVVKIAHGGLRRRGLGEEVLLQPLEALVDSGVCPAELLLELFHGRWSGSVEPIFDELHY